MAVAIHDSLAEEKCARGDRKPMTQQKGHV